MIKFMVAFMMMCFCSTQAQAFCFQEAGQEYGINPALLAAIAWHESNHSLNQALITTNKDGSQDLGLMAINSSHIRPWNLDKKRLLTDACYNVKVAAHVLSGCIARYGATPQAVGCYNAVSPDKMRGYADQIRFIMGGKLTAKQIKGPAAVSQREPDPIVLLFALINSGSGYSGLFRAE